MNDLKKWRFAPSHFGQRKGLSTGDAETFKRNPLGNFGREVVQNSIDAKLSEDKAVIVEFKIFNIATRYIPGIEDLKDAARRCMEYWKDSQPSYYEEYKKILSILQKKTIKCLRISDSNTTGLTGIERPNSSANNKFLALTKSSGVSDKNDSTAGGSKGVGKNAAFLLSSIKTVFYSSLTSEGYKGYIGVADFISGYINDNDISAQRDYTRGEGYFSKDEYNEPCDDLLNLDESYKRKECGTDIYILGFQGDDNWFSDITTSIMDSFMTSLIKEQLAIKISGVTIDKEKLSNIIDDLKFIDRKKVPALRSQYNLLMDIGDIRCFNISTKFGQADLKVLVLGDKDSGLATHKCSMIRYPYMKICDFALSKHLNYSAICIIEKNILGERLREIENPQHTEWETKRLSQKEKKIEMDQVLQDIKNQINDAILQCFKTVAQNVIDPFGAGAYLAEIEEKGNAEGKVVKASGKNEVVEISQIKRATEIEKNTYKEDVSGVGVQPEIGAVDKGGENVVHPTGHNESKGGSYGIGDDVDGYRNGENVILKKVHISGIRYRIVVLNKELGKYKITFIAPVTKHKCYLSLYLLGDELSQKTQLPIEALKCNGKEIVLSNYQDCGPFEISKDQKIVLEIKTNQNDYFASEVKIYYAD